MPHSDIDLFLRNPSQLYVCMIGALAQTGMILLSPQSQSSSWDVIRGGYGPDVQIMDKTLKSVFERYTIDPKKCSIGGFSDGASYALSIGTTNGDLFSHIVAFSPGFMRPGYLVCLLSTHTCNIRSASSYVQLTLLSDTARTTASACRFCSYFA